MANYGQSGGNLYGNQASGTVSGQRNGNVQEQGNFAQNGRYAYSESQPYGARIPPTALTNADFLTRVESVKKEIDSLSSSISAIASLHQRTISSTDNNSTSAALESVVSQTQISITRIKDQIKYLEKDSAQSGGNTIKHNQVRSLKRQLKSKVEQYQQEELTYKKRYQEQIARHYRIIHPEASEVEIKEAMNADWGNEGVFQTALQSNRTGAANAVLGAVRARHNDIQKIERTIQELNQLIQDLNEAIVTQEPLIQSAEQQTQNVLADTEGANKQLNTAIGSARRARKLKWICCIIVLLLILGAVFAILVVKKLLPGMQPGSKSNDKSS